MNKLIHGAVLCLSVHMAGCVGATDEAPDDTVDQSDALTNRVNGPMRNPGQLNHQAYLRLRLFIIKHITTAVFHRIWGGIGTVAQDGEFRLDVQNPANGMQNLQIQMGSRTVGTVLVPTALAHLDGDANNEHSPAHWEVREFTNQLRRAFLRSIWSIVTKHPQNYRLDGSYDSAPNGRELLSLWPDVSGYAGPLLGQADANQICPLVAGGLDGVWTGQWRTDEPGRDSVCDVNPEFTLSAGPIVNNMDAQAKCPVVCSKEGLRWTGNWNTVIWAKESVCACL